MQRGSRDVHPRNGKKCDQSNNLVRDFMAG